MAGPDDRINFITAEKYFENLSAWEGPDEVVAILQDPPADISDPEYWRGVTLKFEQGELCVIQFIRPTLWRVRFDPTVRDLNDYGDLNTRTIVGDFTSTLIRDLDDYNGIKWETKLEQLQDGYWVFKSVVTSVTEHSRGHYEMGEGVSLYLYEKPFRIQATRSLKPVKELYPIPTITDSGQSRVRAVWNTSEQTFRYQLDPEHDMLKSVTLDVIKAGHGEFVGWGEQGGTSFMKKPSFMNYFNSDNMQYRQVYNKGSLDPREPLYHSDPFWLDLNSNPEHMNVTATFIDNYSQIAVDFGKTNAGYIKIGTRFGAMDLYIISADTVGDIALHWDYWALVLETKIYPWESSVFYNPLIQNSSVTSSGIQPLDYKMVMQDEIQYVEGYGYMDQQSLFAVIKQYRDAKIPLDGLHIDVPFQNNYRTFTIGENKFPNPKDMFRRMKQDGIKCSTNITPVISANDLGGEGYKTLQDGLTKGYFIKDHRYTKGAPENPYDMRYMCYGGGKRNTINPSNNSGLPEFTNDNGEVYRDQYDFKEQYNSGRPYRGGVSYGYSDGTPGHYADLNDKVVRKWWGEQYEYLFKMGLEFVWQDMTTPSIGEQYGDMKGFPSRLLLDIHPGNNAQPVQKLAIETWALYSYNLHKATFHGLNNLKSRDNKRNFILGRGSFAGMYRFAGLWTGDNASSWDFWRITVPQVLSIGLNGVCTAGSDTGGFEPFSPAEGIEEKYCDPELLIRWYAGSTLLPWLRSHYVSRAPKGGEKKKWFQEPYAYPIHFEDDRKRPKPTLDGQAWLYYGAQYITQYFIQLRYSLLQVLYDAMFENQMHGLPIARSMLMTDPQDTTFFNESQIFLDDQYVAGQNLLIAPIMHSRREKGHEQEQREIYLPLGYFWYPSNLRPVPSQRVALEPAIPGGSVIERCANIPSYPDHRPGDLNKPDPRGYHSVLPSFVREGCVIPQIEPRDYIGDATPNPIEFHVYPFIRTGHSRKSEYTTYLDDGVSRSSEPKDIRRTRQIIDTKKRRGLDVTALEARKYDEYRAVTILHEMTATTRTISITRKAKDGDYDPSKEIGHEFSIILWYDPYHFGPGYTATITPAVSIEKHEDLGLKAVVIKVKETLGTTENIVLRVEKS